MFSSVNMWAALIGLIAGILAIAVGRVTAPKWPKIKRGDRGRVGQVVYAHVRRPTDPHGNATPLMYVIALRNEEADLPDVRRVMPDQVEGALEVDDRVLVYHNCKVRKLELGKGGLIEAGLVTSTKF